MNFSKQYVESLEAENERLREALKQAYEMLDTLRAELKAPRFGPTAEAEAYRRALEGSPE